MNSAKLSLILLSALITCCNSFSARDKISHPLNYEDVRNTVMDAEDLLSLGGTIILSEEEIAVNRIFMEHKLAEIAEGFDGNDEKYAPGMHFFKAKPLIEKSEVFQFLKEMPKGALLHAHNSALVSSEWIIRNLTYMEGMLTCINKYRLPVYTFRQTPKHKCTTAYTLVSFERSRAPNKKEFDDKIEQAINLYTPYPEIEYSSLTKVWTKFQNIFSVIGDALKYIPAFRYFHWRLMEELYQDGIMYLELRMEFKTLYDSNGREFPPQFACNELITLVDSFRATHPDFLGVKVIYSTNRKIGKKNLLQKMNEFKKFHKEFPNFVIGFDLVGQEDLGEVLYTFVDELKQLPETAKYFFHAGETNWYGSSSDYNLIDAILLNSTRIGHGFSLAKHPVLWNTVKKRDIALEVSPISNQVLNLVWDLRNHPGAFYISENIPIVITSDDPGFWNAKGLSYDFYYAIMSFSPNHAGLRTLKQLVWNSIKYSVLKGPEQIEAYRILNRQWGKFLGRVMADGILRNK